MVVRPCSSRPAGRAAAAAVARGRGTARDQKRLASMHGSGSHSRTLMSPLSIAPVGLEPTGRHSGDAAVLIGGGRPLIDFRVSSMAAMVSARFYQIAEQPGTTCVCLMLDELDYIRGDSAAQRGPCAAAAPCFTFGFVASELAKRKFRRKILGKWYEGPADARGSGSAPRARVLGSQECSTRSKHHVVTAPGVS